MAASAPPHYVLMASYRARNYIFRRKRHLRILSTETAACAAGGVIKGRPSTELKSLSTLLTLRLAIDTLNFIVIHRRSIIIIQEMGI